MSLNTLRDIWEVTDKKSMEVMKASGGIPPSAASSTITNFSTKPTGLFKQDKIQSKLNSRNNNQPCIGNDLLHFSYNSENSKNLSENQSCIGTDLLHLSYNKENSKNLDDDTASLVSIWTPTDKDKLVTQKKVKEELLIDFETPQDEIPLNKNLFPINEAKTKINTGNESKDCLLIDFDSPLEITPTNVDQNPQNGSDDDSSDTESEVTNNYGSDESQDDLNKKTSIKYKALPKQYRKIRSGSSSSDTSDTTIKCISSSKKTSGNENAKINSNVVLKKEEQLPNKNIKANKDKSPGAGNENIIKANYDQNCLSLQTKFKTDPKYHVSNNGSYKHTNNYPRYRGKPRKGPNMPINQKISRHTLDSEDIFSVCHENLTFQERDSASGITREKKIAFKTQEVIGKKGNKTKKITYVQGRIIEDADDSNKNSLKWNSNICDLKLHNKKTVFHNNIPRNKFTQNYMPDNEYVPKYQSYFKEPRSMNFGKSFFQQSNSQMSQNRMNRSLSHKQIGNSNVKYYNQNERKHEKKEVVAISGGRVVQNKIPFDNEKKFHKQIDDIVSCNEKFRKQQHMEEQLSWNVVHTTNETHSEEITGLFQHKTSDNIFQPVQDTKEPQSSFENKISTMQIASQQSHTVQKQVIGNVYSGSQKNSGQDIKQDHKANQNFPNSNKDLKETQQLGTVPKQVIDNVYSGSQKSNGLAVKQGYKTNPYNSNSNKEAHQSSTVPKQVIKEKQSHNQDPLNRFVFMQNLVEKCQAEKSTQIIVSSKTINDSILEMEKKCSVMKCSIMKLKEEKAEKKYAFINLVKEMGELIVGCHRAIEVYRSFYTEWIVIRSESIQLLENAMKIITDPAKRSFHFVNIADVFKLAMDTATSNSTEPAGTKIGSTIGSFISNLFRSAPRKEEPKKSDMERELNEIKIKDTFQKDIDTTSFVYIYGVQCSTQFEETTQLITKLHRKIREDTVEAYFNDKNVLDFLKEISENDIAHDILFYKRLMLEYKRLIKQSQSDESRVFVRIFNDIPEALSVIELVSWRFDPNGFNNSIVIRAWENLFSLFYQPVNIDELIRNIQSCLYFLKEEKKTLEHNFKTFFK